MYNFYFERNFPWGVLQLTNYKRGETFDTTNANGTTVLVRGVGCKLLTNIKTRTATMGDAMQTL